MASRRSLAKQPEIGIEDSELTELDRESCIELLNLRNVTDSELQERIVSVSGGNPFVIGTLCDMAESSSLSLDSVESLRSDTLEEVRLKTWRKLFNEVQDLQELVNRAGLLPYLDRNVMNTIVPTMNTDQWTRMVHLSFMKDRGDGTYVLHDLARDLVVAELGDRFHALANEVEKLLEDASEKQEDRKLLGLSISVLGLHSPESAVEKVFDNTLNHSWRGQYRSAVELVDSTRFGSLREQTIVSLEKAFHLTFLDRVAEAEHILKESVEILDEMTETDPESNEIHLMKCLGYYGVLLQRINKPVESGAMFDRAYRISQDIDTSIGKNSFHVIVLCWWYGVFLWNTHRLNKAADVFRWSLSLMKLRREQIVDSRDKALTLNRLGYVLFMAGKPDEAEEACNKSLDTGAEDYNRWSSLTLLGDIYWRTSRLVEAVKVSKECLRSIREYIERETITWRIVLTDALRHYALILKLVGEFSEAESHYREALEITKKMVNDAPEVHLPTHSVVLNDFAVFKYETHRYSEADEFYEEALRNYERLSQDWPDRFRKYIAWTLNNYSILLRETGEVTKAREFYHKALDIGRELAQEYPENVFHSHLLGLVLNNLGVLLRKMNENDEAEEALREALEVRQALATKTPDVFLDSVATTLNNLGVVLSTTDRLPEAQKVSLRGLKIRRELGEKSPDMHNGRLGFALNNLGNIYKLSDDPSKAEKCYQEALDIFENLAARAPSVYQRYVIMVLSNLLLYHSQQSEADKAGSIRRRLEQLDSGDASEQEIWIEIEETEADAY